MSERAVNFIKEQIESFFGDDKDKYISNLDVLASTLLDGIQSKISESKDHPIRIILKASDTVDANSLGVVDDYKTLDINSKELENALINPDPFVHFKY